MKYIILLFLIQSGLWASTVSIPESSLANGLRFLLTRYSKQHPSQPIESWPELAKVSGGFDGLNSVLKNGSVTDYFAFVPLEQRGRFPLGNLILVQSKPMPWPDAWKGENPEKPGQYFDHPRHQDIRFLVYEKDGKFIAERWYETKFQAMLAETGLTVPPPTPYYPPPPTAPGEKAFDPPKPAAPVVALKTVPVIAPLAPAAIPEPAPVAPPPVKSSNPLWWIVGAIATLVSVMFVARRKKQS